MISESFAMTFISRSCVLLDEERFDDYLSLYAEAGQYSITTYSPDLRKNLTYLALDCTGLTTLFRNLSRHVRMPGRLMRHPSGFLVESKDDEVFVTTSLLVIHTDLDGTSHVFAAGRYHDSLILREGKPAIKSREVRLDTRQFGPGSHVPL